MLCKLCGANLDNKNSASTLADVKGTNHINHYQFTTGDRIIQDGGLAMNETQTAYREYILQVVEMIHDIGRLKRIFHLTVSLRRKERVEPTRVDRKMEAITRADERRIACIRILDEVKDEKALERIYWYVNRIIVR